MADFTLSKWFAVAVQDVGFKTDISSGFGGKEWRDSVCSVSILEFSFPLKVLNATDLAAFVTFMQARKGAYETFNFVCPGPWNGFSSTPYVVRNVGDPISWSWASQNYSSATVKFREVK